MSDTIIDLPKIAAMLDNGWTVYLEKNRLGGYIAMGQHENDAVWDRAKERWKRDQPKFMCRPDESEDIEDSDFGPRGLIVDVDATPEQALTRLAYKVHGEVI